MKKEKDLGGLINAIVRNLRGLKEKTHSKFTHSTFKIHSTLSSPTPIRLFLASSSELEADRREFEVFVRRKNKELVKKGLYLDLEIWEDALDYMSQTRLQERYNDMVRDCDVFVMLFFTKVGEFTMEEFEAAFQSFRANQKPIIYTFFKTTPVSLEEQSFETIKSLFDFKEKLNELGHFYTRYDTFSDLQVHLSGQLNKLQDIGFFDETPDDETPPSVAPDAAPAPRVYLNRLPVTGADVFGREKELQLLFHAWENPQTNVLSFIAWGGVGKSALVNRWLTMMAQHGYHGARRVYAWSFYSQGTQDRGHASADSFFDDAFRWFGHTGDVPKSPTEKGRLLADLIAKEKTLLILDGLEPLQHPPGVMHGQLKDQALMALLKKLARLNNGLCLITSRATVTDLKSTDTKTTHSHPLENLSTEAGVMILRNYQLKGPESALEAAVTEYDGHALALNLLGSYLQVVYQGDIHQRDRISALNKEQEAGGHARNVMASYEHWFAQHDRSELDILYLMGLFDRPAEQGAIDALTAAPPIPGLTDRLEDLSFEDWQYALHHLRELNLLAKPEQEASADLDCHPLIREHFGEMLQTHKPEAWKEAHTRLYEYYKNKPDKDLPDTILEMEPLFAAVTHGCLAGKHQEAFVEVYWERIRRKGEAYTVKKLGAFGADLACVAHFFEKLWDRPAAELSANFRAGALSWAGFRLRAVGRLKEAMQPMKAGMEMYINDEEWKFSAMTASNLSELSLTLGEVNAGLAYGEKAVGFADQSEDGFHMESKRAAYADALFQAGDLAKAEQLFGEAEAMQKKRQPECPYLYGLSGFQYCEVLLDKGAYQEVLKRAKETIQIAERHNWLLDIALDKLSIGKALFLQALNTGADDLSAAKVYLYQAVEGLREAGTQHRLPWGLLARAALSRHEHAFSQAWEDLDEVLEIASYGGMRLHLTDYHLEVARLVQAQLAGAGDAFEVLVEAEGKTLSREEMEAQFWAHVAAAKALVEETGYFRRMEEVQSLSG